ncbi:pyridoxal-phosphate-dependent aminotransferase family protein [Sulfobacillus harzensis]|uniref:Alanine--glyoxylate aminotransferase family protein n=1 Tax=Sulfobacillus harzensis TaxID=2729629 RepID=A0A7Y0Q137_9FIRM|nr:alanine--glyoxylate aminotransferase family protein [Sulfobacillus harzensis]NMP21693.1 alanine--glyoxylate aminotransferase family protein [Sulfobacillus harzensis]
MHILLPGPTPIPEAVQEALIRAMSDHRGTLFGQVDVKVRTELATLLGAPTKDHIAILPASGTGGLEAACENLLSPGDRALVVETGLFGRRFREVAEAHGVDVECVEIPWGQAFNPQEIAERVRQKPYRAILVTHNETSTGVLNPVEALAQAIGTDPGAPLMIVDSISGVPSIPLTLGPGLDVIIAASQKGFMCPPGLAILALSERARQSVVSDTRPGRFYFDLRPYLSGRLPYTPAIGLWHALHAALGLLRAEGAFARLQRHRMLRDMVRHFARAGGLTLLVEDAVASPTVTALGLPSEMNPGDLRRHLENAGLQIAGGLGLWHERAIRIGHVGHVDRADLAAGLTLMAPHLPHSEQALAAMIPFLKEA